MHFLRICFGIHLTHLVYVYCDGTTRLDHAVFDQGWIGEVEVIPELKPSGIWSSFFNSSRPVKTFLPELRKIQTLWDDDYIKSSFGDVLVQTEPGRENRTTDYCGLERMGKVIQCDKDDFEYMRQVRVYYSLGDYVGNLSDPNFDRYVISMLDERMASELPFLPGFSCGLKRRYYQMDTPEDELHATEIQELNFWFSRGNTYSTLHYDMNHQIMCQIDGRKEWRFWDLRTEHEHIPMWSEFYQSSQFRSDDSPIDPLNVDLDRFPQFLNAKWINTTLNPGECLLIPNYHWLHYVRSFQAERNMGFSVHINPRAITPEHFYDCDELVSNISHSSLGNFSVTVPFPGDVRESEYNVARMGRGYWKDYALHAAKELIRGRQLEDILSEITNGRSSKSKRIRSLIGDIPANLPLGEYVLSLFNHAPLWREIDYLASFQHR